MSQLDRLKAIDRHLTGIEKSSGPLAARDIDRLIVAKALLEVAIIIEESKENSIERAI